ncbi:hypothetical protein JCM10212_003292 [Sporobolomyces blumeae]
MPSDGGFLSNLRSLGSSSHSSGQREPPPASTSTSSSAESYLPDPSALLADLAPNLLSNHGRLFHPHNVSAHQASLPSSSSTSTSSSTSSSTSHPARANGAPALSASESLRRKVQLLTIGMQIGHKGKPSWGELNDQLYIRDRVDELLRLPVPPAPFSLSTSPPSHSGLPSSTRLIEPPPKPGDPVPLIQGFKATIPTSTRAKLERRRRRAILSEQQLGLGNGERLGLKEKGERARGLLLGDVREEDEDGTAAAPGEAALQIGRNAKPVRRKGKGSLHSRTGSALSDLSSTSSAQTAVAVPSRVDLERDVEAISSDMSNVAVRRALLNGQIKDVEKKIRELEGIRDGFRKQLLGLREEELELEDELEGIEATLARLPLVPTAASTSSSTDPSSTMVGSSASTQLSSTGVGGTGLLSNPSSRRRKGPAFLPSEHDDLPTGVAFMTLHGHLSPLTSLDFSAPYQTLVTSSHDSSVRLWDLSTGEPTGFLKGHDGIVKVVQVEGGVCVTGGKDGRVKVWDLERAEEEFANGSAGLGPGLGASSAVKAEEEDVFSSASGGGGGSGLINGRYGAEDDGLLREEPGSIRDGAAGTAGPQVEDHGLGGSCLRTMEGHTKAVTTLYFDGPTLLTGSSDSTLRQWDLNTGQCVLTMDILWALSNPNPASSTHYPASSYSASPHDPFSQSFSQTPLSSTSSSYNPYATNGASSPPTTPRKTFSSLRRQSSLFDSSPGAMSVSTAMDRTYYADGSWEPFEDFVGGVQFWGYALASGTRDGCVRMWDMRTGQAHRTLVGHTGPVTCVQFDEFHLVSGSLDKSIRIWDLRTGSISDTIKYDYPITSLQFDNRKIVTAAGENGVKLYNRTTLEHNTLSINGHTGPVERLRFMDRYLATGARDCTVKIWALP